MSNPLLDHDRLDELVRRDDELTEETRGLYGAWPSRDEMHQEQRAGWIPALLACVAFAFAFYGVCGLVRWLIQSSAP